MLREVINDPEGSDSDQASKAYMINRSGNRVRVKIDNAFWEKEQAIKRTSAKRRGADDDVGLRTMRTLRMRTR